MPGKSRHRRGRHSVPSTKKKGRSSRPSLLARPPIVTETHEPPSTPDVSLPSVSVPAPTVKPAAFRYPYMATELRTIGILAAIMLIVLAALAVVLS